MPEDDATDAVPEPPDILEQAAEMFSDEQSSPQQLNPLEDLEQTLKSKDFTPSTPPDEFLPSFGLPPWLIILLTILVIVAIYFARRFMKSERANDTNLAKRAYKEAEGEIAKAATADLSAGEVATLLSLTVRRYLQTTAKEPALFQTHEEFLISEAALTSLPQGARQPTSDFFNRLAELKYGQQGPGAADKAELISEAKKLLLSLYSTQPQRIA